MKLLRKAALPYPQGDDWSYWILKCLPTGLIGLSGFFIILTQPFGVTLDLADRHPWESVDRYLDLVHFKTFYYDAIYITGCRKV